jgi:tetratricopeptide (TPR) repeat protein
MRRIIINIGKLNPLLRITLLSGLILFVLAGAVLSAIFLIERSSTRTTRQEESFSRLLRNYDGAFGELAGTEREFAYLNRELDRIEKRTLGVESWLSVLKRRRALAAVHPPSAENYANSINRALKAYPMSQPITAVAAAALVKNSAVNREAEQKLRNWLSVFQDGEFNRLRLSLHVILGDFRNPGRASLLPDDIVSDGTESISANMAVLKALRADYRGAAADIQTMLNSRVTLSDSTLRFAGEYFYDFGDLQRSAEIFNMINDEKALVRQADALYLAGFTDMSRSIWSMLAASSNENSLYNLALTTDDAEEAAFWLEKLVTLDSASGNDCFQFGLIRYSRLLDYQGALSLLQNTEGIAPSRYPFVDLEICKRNAQSQESGRQAAEAWLLLDRHPENEDLYNWASRLFFYQRLYAEAEILLRRVEQLQFDSQWIRLYRAVLLMREGDIDDAQEILRAIPAEDADWPVFANLGQILEIERSHLRAIEQYEEAAARAPNPKTASRILLRIARCSSTLGYSNEARRVLEYALELDPENLTAALELERMTLPRANN